MTSHCVTTNKHDQGPFTQMEAELRGVLPVRHKQTARAKYVRTHTHTNLSRFCIWSPSFSDGGTCGRVFHVCLLRVPCSKEVSDFVDLSNDTCNAAQGPNHLKTGSTHGWSYGTVLQFDRHAEGPTRKPRRPSRWCFLAFTPTM